MSLKSFLSVLQNDGEYERGNGDLGFEENAFYMNAMEWIRNFDTCPEPLCHIIPTAFIYDYRKSSIVYLSSSIEHLTGYNKSTFMGGNGMLKFIEMMNPNDFKIYNEQIFPKEMAYLSAIPAEERKDLIFSSTIRIKYNDGPYKTLLLKKCFITGPAGEPIYEFCIVTNISSIKRELSINHTIEKFRQEVNFSSFTKVMSEDYFPEMSASVLSAREKEILLNLSLGIKRRDVGEKLFISDNTVANHIKAILRKTSTKNIREAIAICKMNGII